MICCQHRGLKVNSLSCYRRRQRLSLRIPSTQAPTSPFTAVSPPIGHGTTSQRIGFDSIRVFGVEAHSHWVSSQVRNHTFAEVLYLFLHWIQCQFAAEVNWPFLWGILIKRIPHPEKKTPKAILKVMNELFFLYVFIIVFQRSLGLDERNRQELCCIVLRYLTSAVVPFSCVRGASRPTS